MGNKKSKQGAHEARLTRRSAENSFAKVPRWESFH